MPSNGPLLLKSVAELHNEKQIAKEIIFNGIEAALQVAIERAMGEEVPIVVRIDRLLGTISAKRGELDIDPEQLGRIPAQSARNLITQKILEVEADQTFQAFLRKQGKIVVGTIERIERGSAIVIVNKTETLLPRGEQIPGEWFEVGGIVRAVVMEVRRTGHRVRVILSRCHPDFVRCLFEQEVPEIHRGTVEITALAREPAYRTKIAVSSNDSNVNAVVACVGPQSSRIKRIIEELGGERIDIVRWNSSLQVLIPNALQPAEIKEVFLYTRLGRAIVLVEQDQLSLAIGRRGQNVRLSAKLVGWDIEIMTDEELDECLMRADQWFSGIPNVTTEMLETLITEGCLTYRDLTFFEPKEIAMLLGIDICKAHDIIEFAEEQADIVEEEDEVRIVEERMAARDKAFHEASVFESEQDSLIPLVPSHTIVRPHRSPGQDLGGSLDLDSLISLVANTAGRASQYPAHRSMPRRRLTPMIRPWPPSQFDPDEYSSSEGRPSFGQRLEYGFAMLGWGIETVDE